MCSMVFFLRYLLGRWRLASLKNGLQPLDVSCLKCTDMRSNHRPSTTDMGFVYSILVQFVTLNARPLYRCLMQASDKRSTQSLQTCIRPSYFCTQNHDSSDRITLSYQTAEWHCRSVTVRVAFSLIASCWIVSRGNGRRSHNPHCFKRRHTIRADTGHTANMSILLVNVRNVIVSFCSTDFTVRLSFRVFIMWEY